MEKWLAGVAGGVAVALLVLYLTRVLEPRLPSYPRLVFAEATANSGTRTDSLWPLEAGIYSTPLYKATSKLVVFARGSFTVSNEGDSRANLCHLHWTTDPLRLSKTDPSEVGSFGSSWAKSEMFSVPRDGEASLTVTLDLAVGDTNSFANFRVYCENAKSETYHFDISKWQRSRVLRVARPLFPQFQLKP